MRLVDVLLAFPGLLLAIGLIAITGPGVGPVIVASAVFGVPVFARLVRGSTLAAKERAFVEAARGLGAGDGRIMFRHLLPAVVAPSSSTPPCAWA
jgi:ABC-type dipeptide/oligopeptide/nickel transport system permease subunit